MGTEFMWNFGKYTCSACVAIFSFAYKNTKYGSLKGLWLCNLI